MDSLDIQCKRQTICRVILGFLKQKLCRSRLRPPPLHPQGRRGLGWGRAQLRPCGYKILQKTHSTEAQSWRAGRTGPRPSTATCERVGRKSRVP